MALRLHLDRRLTQAAIVTAIALLAAIALSESADARSPQIVWSEPSLTEDLRRGVPHPISVSFVPTADLDALEIRLTGPINELLTLSTGAVTDLIAGEPTSITLMAYASRFVEPGEFEGSVQLRAGRRVIARPLPVSLRVADTAPARLDYVSAPRPGSIRPDSGTGVGVVDGELLILLTEGYEHAAIHELLDLHALSVVGEVPALGMLQVRSTTAADTSLVDSLTSHPDIDGVTVNSLLVAHGFPTDPNYSEGRGNQVGFKDIRAVDAWRIAAYLEGNTYETLDDAKVGDRRVLVAVVDSGIEYTHHEFGDYPASTRIVPGPDLIDGDDPRDEWGHGTSVAGILGAEGNGPDETFGMAGLCWECQILNVRVITRFEELGDIPFTTQAQMLAGATYALDAGADVVNISAGTPWLGSVTDLALWVGVAALAESSNSIIFASAGNENLPVVEILPALAPGIIAVGAVCGTEMSERCSPAHWGTGWFGLPSGSNYGSLVEIVAPGNRIYTTQSPIAGEDFFTSAFNGTSAAAPFVSGLAALLLSVDYSIGIDRNLEVSKLREAILGSADREVLLESAQEDFPSAGRVDAFAALVSYLEMLEAADGSLALFDRLVPSADAGADEIVTAGERVMLSGASSTDPNGDPLSFAWRQTAGPPVVLDPSSDLTAVSFLAPGDARELTFELTVHDGFPSVHFYDRDLVSISVIPASDEHSIERVSVASDGSQGDNNSSFEATPSISVDGRFVAFESSAKNLSSGGDGPSWEIDIFVHDRVSGGTARISERNSLNEMNPSISGDGRYVAFDRSDFFIGDQVLIHDRFDATTTVVGAGHSPALSEDGRFVAFSAGGVLVHDRLNGTTATVSIAMDGSPRDAHSPSISGDGRFVSFASSAGDLVPNDTNASVDVFIYDRLTEQTSRVSVSSLGAEGAGSSYPGLGTASRLSRDGRYVAFASEAANLVEGDTNGIEDVFVHDRITLETTRVSVASDGSQATSLGTSRTWGLAISPDGRFVAFASGADGLIPEDSNYVDVFVHDRRSGETVLASASADGAQGNSGSTEPSLSGDGQFVAFSSWARNLVPDDTNGASDVFVADVSFTTP